MILKMFCKAANFVVFVSLCACGSGGGTLNLQMETNATRNIDGAGGGNGSGSSGKPLFSSWSEASGFSRVDLSTFQFAVKAPATLMMITGQSCVCQLTIQGTQSTGTMTFASCSGSYPNCSTFESSSASATYTKTATNLEICLSASSCITMK